MVKNAFSRFGRGRGPVLRLRGRKRFIVPLNRNEIIQILIFLLLAAFVLLLGMYIGWWTFKMEEKEWKHQNAQHSAAFVVFP